MTKRVGIGSKKILPGLVIPAAQEAEVRGSKVDSLPGLLRELEASLDKSTRLCLQTTSGDITGDRSGDITQ